MAGSIRSSVWCQEFSKADELYQAGMKVDPQNANLLVHRGIVALQSVGKRSSAVVRTVSHTSQFQETFPRPWSSSLKL